MPFTYNSHTSQSLQIMGLEDRAITKLLKGVTVDRHSFIKPLFLAELYKIIRGQ